jgi:hypothetical protein
MTTTLAGELPDEVLKKLSSRALLDSDSDCRREAVKTFLNLSQIEDSEWDQSPKERYRKCGEAMVKEHFHEGIKDDSCEVRFSWIELAGIQIEHGEDRRHVPERIYTALSDSFHAAESPALIKLFNVAVKDGDPGLQGKAIQALQRCLEDGNVAPFFSNIILLNRFSAKLRALIAAKLAEVLGSCLSEEDSDRALTVLTRITEPPGARGEGQM